MTKRKYARMFAVVETYRHSMTHMRNLLKPEDADKIESDVRERIRKAHEKALATKKVKTGRG